MLFLRQFVGNWMKGGFRGIRPNFTPYIRQLAKNHYLCWENRTMSRTEGTYEIHYVYKDHLGSWTTITNAGGVVEREQSFDAWGNMRDPETWSGDYNNTLMFDRGFTGHEHLYDFGLINMNGRVYDPVMSTFLSPDNYIQAPDNSQNFNRYAYCLNNPLKYTDPSGESIVLAVLVGAFWSSRFPDQCLWRFRGQSCRHLGNLVVHGFHLRRRLDGWPEGRCD